MAFCELEKIMAVLPILYYPDPRLRTVAEAVDRVDSTILSLIDDMFETMYAARGIGLAATQVDKHVRVIVMDLSAEDESPAPQVFINPSITVINEEPFAYQEGCLSIPEFYDTIERPSCVKIDALDKAGQPFTQIADGLLAVCIQHEIDHLNGVLFVDYLSRLKQDRAIDKVKKVIKKQNAS